MKIGYEDFKKSIFEKFELCSGKAQHTMINGGIMELWLSDNKDGIYNSKYPSLNCKFDILYAIYEKAVSLGGEMYLGASAAMNGQRIGSENLSGDTIDGFISLNFYGSSIGDTTLRRSTYYAVILEWTGLVTNHRGGYITVNKKFLSED